MIALEMGARGLHYGAKVSTQSVRIEPPFSRELFGRHPVFCTLGGGPLAAAYVRRMLKRLAVRAGIDKRVHAHGLRHTHAAQLRAEGIDVAIISRQLGHASITTTARYLDHLAPRAVIEATRRRTWTERESSLLTCCSARYYKSAAISARL